MAVIFSDEVVQATDLRRRQQYWFERSRGGHGLTIVQGRVADLVLAPRHIVSINAQAAHYSRLAARFVLEFVKSQFQLEESEIFPWFKDLDKEERQEFFREFAETFASCTLGGEWKRFEELIEDWRATAEANQTSGLLENWQTRGLSEELT